MSLFCEPLVYLRQEDSLLVDDTQEQGWLLLVSALRSHNSTIIYIWEQSVSLDSVKLTIGDYARQ